MEIAKGVLLLTMTTASENGWTNMRRCVWEWVAIKYSRAPIFCPSTPLDSSPQLWFSAPCHVAQTCPLPLAYIQTSPRPCRIGRALRNPKQWWQHRRRDGSWGLDWYRLCKKLQERGCKYIIYVWGGKAKLSAMVRWLTWTYFPFSEGFRDDHKNWIIVAD